MNKEKQLGYLRKRKAELRGPGGCSVLHETINSEKVKLLNEIITFIQSEPEEKTNFDVITESPQKLFEFILEQYGYSQIKDYGKYFNLRWWLNEKAGE